MKLKYKYFICLIILLIVQVCMNFQLIINTTQNIQNNTDYIMQGWLKYVIVHKTNQTISSEFLKNKYFFKQMQEITNSKLKVKENGILKDIPNIDYYYFELSFDRINIYTARFGKFRHLKAKIVLRDLTDPSDCKNCNFTVQDLGKFNEGNCFAIRLRNELLLEACADSLLEKINWINHIKNYEQLSKKKEKSQLLKQMYKSFKFFQKVDQPNSIFEFNHNLLGGIRKKKI